VNVSRSLSAVLVMGAAIAMVAAPVSVDESAAGASMTSWPPAEHLSAGCAGKLLPGRGGLSGYGSGIRNLPGGQGHRGADDPASAGCAVRSAASQSAWGSAEAVRGAGSIASVSCWSPGNCAAGGAGGVVVTEVKGIWGRPVVVTGGDIASISCPSAGNCSAGGADGGQAFVVGEADGTWSGADEVAVGLNSDDSATVNSVSCASPGNCSAGGFYTASGGCCGNLSGFVVNEVNGAWGAALPIGGPTDAIGYAYRFGVAAVSCASPGDCSAIGGDDRGPYVFSEVSGAWGGAETLTIPGVAPDQGNIDQGYAVSCASPGNCSAGGGTDNGGTTWAFVVREVNGAWGAAELVPDLPAVTNEQSAVTTVSCSSPGDCSAGGYEGTSVTPQAFVVSEVAGVWGPAEEVPGTVGDQESIVYSVSCASAGSCSAGGLVSPDGYFDTQPFVVDESGGSWDLAGVLSGTAPSQGVNSAVSSVSCSAVGDCAAGGTGNLGGFVADETECQQVRLADGLYQFSGSCVFEERNNTQDVTTEQSNFDGVVVEPAATDDVVTYDDGGSSGHKLVSNSFSTMSLKLGSSQAQLFFGSLDEPLTKPISATIPAGSRFPAT
jgi:hypothetical protein